MLRTWDLIIRKAEFSDWPSIYRNLWRHAESAKYMLWQPTTSEADAMERMRRTLAYQAEHSAWFVYEKGSGQAIGFAGIKQIAPGVWEDSGVALGPDFVGKGYGKQILRALIDYAFREQKAEKMIVSCRSENVPSRKAILACGFTYTHSETREDPRNGPPYILEFYEKNEP